MSALREAFLDELRDLLNAEMQLIKALPKMAGAAQNESLRVAFEDHQNETAKQVRRLARVFGAFDEPVRSKKCKGMEGLLEEAREIIEKNEGDAAMIAAAQKAEHYEIAAYGTLASWAVALGHDDVVQMLNETLQEEKAADRKLTGIAQSVVNSQDSRRESEAMPAKRRQPKRGQAKHSTAQAARRRMPTRNRQTRTTKSRAAKAPRSKRLRASARSKR